MREDSFGSRRAPIHLVALLSLLLTPLAQPVAAQHGHAPERDPSRPDPRTLTAEQWRSDLRFLAQAIRERHPHPFHEMSEKAFEQAVERLDARIPELVGRPFDELLIGTFQSEGLDAALAAYSKFKADPAHRYVDTDRTMNQAGYYLLQGGQVEGAIRVARLNAEAYPDRWNPWDSLGEALAEAGRVEEAIAAYERSLELNPENEGGARMLEKLRADARAHPADPPQP